MLGLDISTEITLFFPAVKPQEITSATHNETDSFFSVCTDTIQETLQPNFSFDLSSDEYFGAGNAKLQN
jgi:hypothetical protein